MPHALVVRISINATYYVGRVPHFPFVCEISCERDVFSCVSLYLWAAFAAERPWVVKRKQNFMGKCYTIFFCAKRLGAPQNGNRVGAPRNCTPWLPLVTRLNPTKIMTFFLFFLIKYVTLHGGWFGYSLLAWYLYHSFVMICCLSVRSVYRYHDLW